MEYYSIDDWLNWEYVYHQLEVIQACFLVFLIFINIYFIYKFSRIKTVHLNFRILFSVLVIQYNVINVSRLLVHLVYYLTSDWFDRSLPNLFCIGVGTLYSSGLFLGSLTVFSLGLERLFATNKRLKYENKNGTIGLILLLTQVFLGLGLSIVFVAYETIVTDEFDIDKSVTSCLFTERYPEIMGFIWIFAGLTYLTGLLFFIWLYKRNKFLLTYPKDDFSFSLTVRHQLYENLATTGLLAPSISLYGLTLIFGIPLVCLTQIYLLNEGRSGHDFVVLTVHQCLLMMCDVYSFSFTLFAMFRFQPLANQVKKDLRHLFCRKTEIRPAIIFPSCEDKSRLYFQHLNQSWNESYQRKVSRFQLK